MADSTRTGIDLCIEAVARRRDSQNERLRMETDPDERAPWLYAIIECTAILAELAKIRQEAGE